MARKGVPYEAQQVWKFYVLRNYCLRPQVSILTDLAAHLYPLYQILIVTLLRILPFQTIQIDLFRHLPLGRLKLIVDLIVVEIVLREQR